MPHCDWFIPTELGSTLTFSLSPHQQNVSILPLQLVQQLPAHHLKLVRAIITSPVDCYNYPTTGLPASTLPPSFSSHQNSHREPLWMSHITSLSAHILPVATSPLSKIRSPQGILQGTSVSDPQQPSAAFYCAITFYLMFPHPGRHAVCFCQLPFYPRYTRGSPPPYIQVSV